MADVIIYLYGGEPNPNDVKLSDPTVLRGGSVVVYSYTGTGGIAFAGSATYVESHSYAGLGGFVFGGTAVVKEAWVWTGTGGLVFGGDGVQKVTRAYVAVGGLTFGGDSTSKTVKIYAGSGGTVFSGAGVQKFGRVYAASGGIIFGGAVATNKAHVAWYVGDPTVPLPSLDVGRLSQEIIGSVDFDYPFAPVIFLIGESGDPGTTPIPGGRWKFRCNLVSTTDPISFDLVLQRRNAAGFVQESFPVLIGQSLNIGINEFSFDGPAWTAGSTSDRFSLLFLSGTVTDFVLHYGGTDGTGIFTPWAAYVATVGRIGEPAGIIFGGDATAVSVPQIFLYTGRGYIAFGGEAAVSFVPGHIEEEVDSRGYRRRFHVHAPVESIPFQPMVLATARVQTAASVPATGLEMHVDLGQVHVSVTSRPLALATSVDTSISSVKVSTTSRGRVKSLESSLVIGRAIGRSQSVAVGSCLSLEMKTGAATIGIGPDLVEQEFEDILLLMEAA